VLVAGQPDNLGEQHLALLSGQADTFTMKRVHYLL
jgi:hypothetical protein